MVGTPLVQGALVELVQDEHEAREPRPLSRLYADALGRVLPLLGVSVLVGLGVGLGFVLLVVPGILLWTRWSVAVPVLVLERVGVVDSMRRSWELVRGRGRSVWWLFVKVLLVVCITQVLVGLGGAMLAGGNRSQTIAFIVSLAASALTTPFFAHALNAAYYRLAEPQRPVISDAPRQTWQTVWEAQDDESWEATRRRLEAGREYL
jgi:hypothetical protein